MEARIAHSMYEALRGDRFAFAYSGAFQDEHSARLIALGEAALADPQGKASAGRLAFVMVEAYQNILRHRAALQPEVEQGEGRSMFLLRCQADGQQVVAVNPVKKGDVLRLRQTLHRLHGMDPAQLKSLFLSGLQNNSEGPRRGAGLGLIEMARRSGSDLGYMLRGLGEEHELFVLAVRMGAEIPYDQVLADAAVLHGTVVQQDVLLMHVGERSVGIREAVLRSVEEDVDLRTDRAADRGRVCLAASGCMDGLAPEGGRYLFALTHVGDHYSMTAGRCVPAEAARTMGAAIAEVNRYDRSDLERHYRDALLKRGDDSGRLDVYELARASVEPLEFASFPVEGGTLALVRAII